MAYENLEEFTNEEWDDDQIMRAHLKREDGKMVLFLQICDELEEFFKNQSDSTGQSERWKEHAGEYHEFYKASYRTDENNEFYENFMRHQTDEFGQSYVRRGKVNLGILRTVGLSEGQQFIIPEQYSEDSMKDSIEQLKDLVPEIYKDYITTVYITCELHRQEL